MAMLHCTDCVFGSFEQNAKTGRWRGSCKRGYTLANPHKFYGADRFFTDSPDELVPVRDPLGREYLRTKDICDKYTHISDVDRAEHGRGGILRFLLPKRKQEKRQ
jgi:hypothetical protein